MPRDGIYPASMLVAPTAKPLPDRPMTEDDFWALPDDLWIYEVITGDLVAVPLPSIDHQLIVGWVQHKLYLASTDERRGITLGGRMAVRLSSHDIARPDIVWISSAHPEALGHRQINGPPDIVIEVVEDGTRQTDLVRKAALYATFGVPEYWTVDLGTDRVQVRALNGATYRVVPVQDGKARSVVYPDFSIDIEEVFAERW